MDHLSCQLGFLIEQHRCIGCKTCQIACKDKNDLPLGSLWRRVIEFEGGSYYFEGNALKNTVYAFWLSLGCNHCADPICVKNCPTKAMYKREEDGLVLHDEKKCIGCQMCVWSCPYGAPSYDSQKGIVGKCDYCVDLQKQGKDPVCVSACPLRALHCGNLEDLQKNFNTQQPTWLLDPNVTQPSIVLIPHKDAARGRRK